MIPDAIRGIMSGMNKNALRALVYWTNVWLFMAVSVAVMWIGSTVAMAPSLYWLLFSVSLLSIIGAVVCFIAFLVHTSDS
jgi:hypothetical protein